MLRMHRMQRILCPYQRHCYYTSIISSGSQYIVHGLQTVFCDAQRHYSQNRYAWWNLEPVADPRFLLLQDKINAVWCPSDELNMIRDPPAMHKPDNTSSE